MKNDSGDSERYRDYISTTAFTEDDVKTLNDTYNGTDTSGLLKAVLHDRIAGKVAVVSSFGAESAVLLHLVATIEPTTPILFLETGKHFPETLQYRDLLVQRLNLSDVRSLTPDPVDLSEKDSSGLRWEYDPDGCCHIRKVLPLAKSLVGFDSWISGRKSFQSSTRHNLPQFELEVTDAKKRLKVNPLANWSSEELTAYIKDNNLLTHPLVAQGFPSIGCSPCTRKVEAGEDPRSGRWPGLDKTECDIHKRRTDHDPVI